MSEYTSKSKAAKLAVLGVVLILVRLYTVWDIWIVIGALILIKALLLLVMSCYPCTKDAKKKKK
ncbi:MAG: hypothetical protein ABH824_06090 [Nanoarchaeota archaeon]|nr:hypothetical protein [Nanoarchaeota archaeon]MBU1632568.1 hypothetical protein [Nanoarchaeota archaeon]MBU1875779.1 hypothetical protein [Nanoarchaeota archaeon]